MRKYIYIQIDRLMVNVRIRDGLQYLVEGGQVFGKEFFIGEGGSGGGGGGCGGCVFLVVW